MFREMTCKHRIFGVPNLESYIGCYIHVTSSRSDFVKRAAGHKVWL